MTPDPVDLRYRTSESLVRADVIWIEWPDGRREARVRREERPDGRPVWRWAGLEVPDFSLEVEGELDSLLVTMPGGAPFGRIRRRGVWRPRLEAADARSTQLTVVEPHGTICGPQGRELGRVETRSPRETRLLVEPVADPTLRSLLLALPIAHATHAMLLLV